MLKKLLFICRHSPYQGNYSQESFDLLITAAAFGQAIALLFIDDGVLQLIKSQEGQRIQCKDMARLLSSLPFYDVTKVYVTNTSLQTRCLTQNDLAVAIEIIDDKRVSELLHNQDMILNF